MGHRLERDVGSSAGPGPCGLCVASTDFLARPHHGLRSASGCLLIGCRMQDNAPDLSMDYSFLLESPVLDREESLVSPHGNDLHRFAVSKLSHQVSLVFVCACLCATQLSLLIASISVQGARQVTDDDESFLLPTPLLPLVYTHAHTQSTAFPLATHIVDRKVDCNHASPKHKYVYFFMHTHSDRQVSLCP